MPERFSSDHVAVFEAENKTEKSRTRFSEDCGSCACHH